MNHYDTVIIGAGVVGTAIARSLSRMELSVLVLEKEPDAAFGTSSRNSGVLHSGIHYTPGSARARFCVAGNSMMGELCRELRVPFRRTGKLTVAFTEKQKETLAKLKKQGETNGVPGMEVLDRDGMERLQPGISGIAALYTPSTGIVNPYELTIALAESAWANGVEFRFLHELTAIHKSTDGGSPYFILTVTDVDNPDTPPILIGADTVVNAAGLGSGSVARMAGIDDYTIYPCRGEYYVLDKRLKDELNLLIYPVPGAHSSGLGIHLTNTIDGNILIGPSNTYIEDDSDTSTTIEIMQALRDEGHSLLPTLEATDFIRSFAGIRPKLAPPEEGGFRDFVIEDRIDLPGFINLVGIESPGLTSAPAVADHVLQLLASHLEIREKRDFISGRPVINGSAYPEKLFADCSTAERSRLAETDPDYGSIVCRCETVPLAEIKLAISRIFGPITFAGIKYRCRAMTGRCQSGFCLQRISEILAADFHIPVAEQRLKGPGTELFTGNMRDNGPTITGFGTTSTVIGDGGTDA